MAGIFVCIAALMNHKQMVDRDNFFLNHQIKMLGSKTDVIKSCGDVTDLFIFISHIKENI